MATSQDVHYGDGGCRGKVRYKTRRLAIARMRIIKGQGAARTPETLEAYRCRSCGKWHLGNRWKGVPTAIKVIKAKVGEAVDIKWTYPDGSEHRERHEAPEIVIRLAEDI